MSFIHRKHMKTHELPRPQPAATIQSFHLCEAIAHIEYEIRGERADPFEGVPINHRRIVAKLMTDYAAYKEFIRRHNGYTNRHSDAAVNYFMQTDRDD